MGFTRRELTRRELYGNLNPSRNINNVATMNGGGGAGVSVGVGAEGVLAPPPHTHTLFRWGSPTTFSETSRAK